MALKLKDGGRRGVQAGGAAEDRRRRKRIRRGKKERIRMGVTERGRQEQREREKKWEKQAGERQRKGVSRSKSVRATCLFVRQVIKTKAQDQPTAFRALTGANLNIRWSSPLANAAFL